MLFINRKVSDLLEILAAVFRSYLVIRGRLYEVWEVYGDPMRVIGGRLYGLYDVWEVSH